MKFEPAPIGESLKGDMTELLHGLHVISAPDDECGVRCSHGGVCTLIKGHDGQHDAEGYCQWGGDIDEV